MRVTRIKIRTYHVSNRSKNTMAHRQDNPITFGNCIHTLCSVLNSTKETGGKIRGLGGAGKIMKLSTQTIPWKKRGGHFTKYLHPK